MVYESRKQSMAWMETDYSKHMLEHLGVLGIMGETVPLIKIYFFFSFSRMESLDKLVTDLKLVINAPKRHPLFKEVRY